MPHHRPRDQRTGRFRGARRLIRAAILAVGALAAACAPRSTEAPRCDLVGEAAVNFTAAEAQDRVIVRSFGKNCGESAALYAVTTADGEVIWAWSTIIQRAFGDTMRGADAETMQAFLDRWANARVERAGATPAWPLPASVVTTLDQATYEDIRARDLPLMCHLTSVARETCVFWEPAAGSAGVFFERDAQEAIAASQAEPEDDEELTLRSEEN